jgi:hypothetical protein
MSQRMENGIVFNCEVSFCKLYACHILSLKRTLEFKSCTKCLHTKSYLKQSDSLLRLLVHYIYIGYILSSGGWWYG